MFSRPHDSAIMSSRLDTSNVLNLFTTASPQSDDPSSSDRKMLCATSAAFAAILTVASISAIPWVKVLRVMKHGACQIRGVYVVGLDSPR